MDLVRDRVCGACTVCCRELTIDDPALRKPAAVTCPHCVVAQGCARHASRPATCRDWHCGWRRLAWLAEDLRPDRSGLLVLIDVSGSPEESGSPETPGDPGAPRAPVRAALVFNVVPAAAAAAAEALSRQASIDVLGALVREDVPVFLGVKDAAGRHGVKLPLNGALGAVARERDGDAVRTAVLRIYRDGADVVRRMHQYPAAPAGASRPVRRPGAANA